MLRDRIDPARALKLRGCIPNLSFLGRESVPFQGLTRGPFTVAALKVPRLRPTRLKDQTIILHTISVPACDLGQIGEREPQQHC